MEPIGFVVACKQFFGFKSDQSLLDFKNELAELTAKDRAEIREGLIAAGIAVKPLEAA